MALIHPPKLLLSKINFGSTEVSSTYGVTSSIYYGYPESFSVDITIDIQRQSDNTSNTPYVYNAYDVKVDDWFGLSTGKVYRIKSIVSVNSNTDISVILEDTELFNLLSDYTQIGNNLPEEEENGLIVEIGDDGLPVYNPLTVQSGLLPFPTYWITDLISRFRYRNYLIDYYQVNPDNTSYTGFSLGDYVYLDSSGNYQKITTINEPTYFTKAFGVVTYIDNDPGRISVRPLGRIVSDLPTLPGNIGDLLYFDPGATNSLVSATPSNGYVLPSYIKIDNTTGLLLNNHPSAVGHGGGGGYQGYQGSQGYQGLGLQGYQGITGTYSGYFLQRIAGSFSGSLMTGIPLSYNINFPSPFNDSYVVDIDCDIPRTFTVQNKTSTGFTINSNSITQFPDIVYWEADDLTSGDFGIVQGATGPQGPGIGSQGPQGFQGIQGNQGFQGAFPSNAFVQGGNSFGATAVLGTLDNNNFILSVGNTKVIGLTTGGIIISNGLTYSNDGSAVQIHGTVSSTSLIGSGVRSLVTNSNGLIYALIAQNYGLFYVSKKYSGNGAAIFTGLSYSNITSTNTSYLQQLNTAIPGDTLNCYPDPWAARNAALDSISNNIISQAIIVVEGNNVWTVGSDNNLNNGGFTGSTSINLVADVGFSNANNTTIASLIQNNISYFFNPTDIYYINATYNIYAMYISDLTDSVFASNIYGYINITQIFGEVNGFAATLFYCDNANASIVLEFAQLTLQQYWGFQMYNVKNLNINITRYIAATCNTFHFGSSRQGDGTDSMITISIGSAQQSLNSIPYPTYVDNWYFTGFGPCNTTRNKLFTVDIENLFLSDLDDGALSYFGAGSNDFINVQFELNVNNLDFAYWGHAISNNGMILNQNSYSATQSGNTTFTYDFTNIVSDAPIIGQFLTPTYQMPGTASIFNVNIFCDNFIRRASPISAGIAVIYFGGYTELILVSQVARFRIEGYYLNQNVGYPMITIYNNSDTFNNIIPGKIKLSGTFINIDSNPIVNVIGLPTSSNVTLAIVDAIFENSGTASAITCSLTGSNIYFKNTHLNHTLDPNVVVVGQSPTIVGNMSAFL